MKQRKFALLVSSIVASSLLLGGCSSTVDSSTGTSKDITNVVLTETSHDYSFFRFQDIAIWVVSGLVVILGGISGTIVVIVRRIRRKRGTAVSGKEGK